MNLSSGVSLKAGLMELKDRMKNIPKEEMNFMIKWFCSLLIAWYISWGLHTYRPDLLEIVYWPLHTHDIKITVIKQKQICF